jgi:hypothetical protein
VHPDGFEPPTLGSEVLQRLTHAHISTHRDARQAPGNGGFRISGASPTVSRSQSHSHSPPDMQPTRPTTAGHVEIF